MNDLLPELLYECLGRVPRLTDRRSARLVCRVWHATMVQLRRRHADWTCHLAIKEERVEDDEAEELVISWYHEDGEKDMWGPFWILRLPRPDPTRLGSTVSLTIGYHGNPRVTLRWVCCVPGDREDWADPVSFAQMPFGGIAWDEHRPAGSTRRLVTWPTVAIHCYRDLFIARPAIGEGTLYHQLNFAGDSVNYTVDTPRDPCYLYRHLADYVRAVLQQVSTFIIARESILVRAARVFNIDLADEWSNWRCVVQYYDADALAYAVSYPPFLERLAAVRAEFRNGYG